MPLIGGSGGELGELIKLISKRPVAGRPPGDEFPVTLENLATATATLKEIDAAWDVVQLQASRSRSPFSTCTAWRHRTRSGL